MGCNLQQDSHERQGSHERQFQFTLMISIISFRPTADVSDSDILAGNASRYVAR